MPTYQYDFDDALWREWKNQVDRDTPLGERLEQLMRADADGRVIGATEEQQENRQKLLDKRDEQEFEPLDEPEEEPDDLLTVDEAADELDIDLDGGIPDALEYVDFPGHQDREACVNVVLACRDYLREHGEATKADLVRDVMPDHSLGYDADDALAKIDTEGERFRGSWWRMVVMPGLKTFDDVAKPSGGSSVWRWSP